MTSTTPAHTKLRSLRKRSGYSVRELARCLGYGDASSTYYSYERASYKKPYLPVPLAEQLADLLAGKGNPPIRREEVLALGAPHELIAGAKEPQDGQVQPPPATAPAQSSLVRHVIAQVGAPSGLNPGPDDVLPPGFYRQMMARGLNAAAYASVLGVPVRTVWKMVENRRPVPPGAQAGEMVSFPKAENPPPDAWLDHLIGIWDLLDRSEQYQLLEAAFDLARRPIAGRR